MWIKNALSPSSGFDDVDLEHQVKNYHALRIYESYRGVVILTFILLAIFSLTLSFLNLYSEPLKILLGLIPYLVLLFFIFKGHRWAIITFMVIWTLERGYGLYLSSQLINQSPKFLILPISIWGLGIVYLCKTLMVENRRFKNLQKNKSNKPTIIVESAIKNKKSKKIFLFSILGTILIIAIIALGIISIKSLQKNNSQFILPPKGSQKYIECMNACKNAQLTETQDSVCKVECIKKYK